MTGGAPPRIFSNRARLAKRRRADALRQKMSGADYLALDMADDVIERLSFLRHEPANALVIGSAPLAERLEAMGCVVSRADPAPSQGERPLDEEVPLPVSGFDLIASMGTLDTVNDLPGALIHLRHALAPGGLMIASLMAAGSLAALRAALLAADGDRPAARMHPMVDVSAGGQLLQRAGFARPVVDSRGLAVRFGSLDALVADLRAQGLTGVLANCPPAMTRAGLERARAAFLAHADGDGRVTETFEMLTLTGWRL